MRKCRSFGEANIYAHRIERIAIVSEPIGSNRDLFGRLSRVVDGIIAGIIASRRYGLVAEVP
jgi:hypothetical protein